MIVLGIDGGLGTFSAAVCVDGQTAAARCVPSQASLEQGLGSIAATLAEAGIRAPQIDRIAVGIGPGTFTGVRIAISYAKSLAQGWRKPLCAVNSFDAIEAGRAVDAARLSVVRGRQGVVSIRAVMDGVQTRASGYIADVLETLGRGSGRLIVCGDTQDVVAGLVERGWSVEEVSPVFSPAAAAVAWIGGTREPAPALHAVRADYGELPAAKVPKL